MVMIEASARPVLMQWLVELRHEDIEGAFVDMQQRGGSKGEVDVGQKTPVLEPEDALRAWFEGRDPDLRQSVELLLSCAALELGAERGRVILRDPFDPQLLWGVAATGCDGFLGQISPKSLPSQCTQMGVNLSVRDARRRDDEAMHFASGHPNRICCMIAFAGHTLGCMELARRSDEGFGPEELASLSEMASELARCLLERGGARRLRVA